MSRQLDAKCINSAMSGYGFSQMLLKAKRIIPQYKPETVFVQYSDWLVERSQSINNVTIQPLQISNPFFYESNGRLELSSPLYSNKQLFVLLRDMAIHRKGFFNQVHTIFQSAFLSMKLDITNMNIYLQQKVNLMPKPSKNKKEILEYTLAEFQKICAENNCTLVVVGLGEQSLEISPSLTYINAEKELQEYAVKTGKGYDTLYYNWTSDYKEVFDSHPNHFAHRKIAETLVSKIQYPR
jgi:hypothetical protein